MAADRDALNRAFWDLGLRFQWDEATWARLAALPDIHAQLVQYLKETQPHLLAVYDVDLLSRIIQERLASPADSRMGMEAHRSI